MSARLPFPFHVSKLPDRRPRQPISWRWTVVLLASLLLHLLALGWANGHFVLPSFSSEPVDDIAMVELPPLAELPKTPQPASAPRPKRKSASKPHAAAASAPIPAVAATPPADPAAPDATPALEAPAASDTDASAADSGAATDAAPAPTPPPTAVADAPVAEQGPVHYKIELPPPSELKYDVKKVSDNGAPFYGSGTISWQSVGDTYLVTGEARVLFFSALNFKSEGMLDDYGIAPVLYSQKNFNRSETNTHFNRDERNSISFSASKLSLPRKGGEQDRASVMWELAGIGRGDREKFTPGAQIDLFVAGDRDGDNWSIRVVGQEEIETGAGKTLAWHVVRMPHAGTYEDQIDIWLAPQFEWCPVKIHYTYKQGGYLDMSMSSFHPLQLAGANAQSAR